MNFEGPNAVIGIDIGASSVKAALLTREGDSVSCKGFLIYPLPELEDQSEEILRGLTAIADKFKAVTTNASLVTARRDVMLKFVEKPQMPPEALKRVMENEFKAGARPDSTSANQYTLLGSSTSEQGETQHILTATFPVPMIHERIALMKKAGLKLIGIYPFALAIRECFWLNYAEEIEEHEPPFLVAFLNFGNSTNQVIVCDKNVLRLARAFPFAGRELTNTIAKEYQVNGEPISLDHSNAEAYKNTIGILNPQEEMGYDPGALEPQVSQMIRRGMDRMTQKLRLSLDYFKGQMKAQVSKIFVFGGGSNMRGLSEVLADKLSIDDVHELAPFINLAYSPTDPEDVAPPPEMRNMIVLAVGAGLSAMMPPDRSLNMMDAIRIDWANELKRLSKTMLVPAMAFLAILLVPALYWYLYYYPTATRIVSLQADQIRLTDEFAPVQKYKKIYDGLVQQEKDLRIRKAFISYIMRKRIFWSKTLWQLAKLMPAEVWTTELTTSEFLTSSGNSGPAGNPGMGGGGPGMGGGVKKEKKAKHSSLLIQMKGQSSSYAALSTFLQDLENSKSFTAVKWKESKRNKNGKQDLIEFSVSFKIKRAHKRKSNKRKKSS